MAKFTLHFLLIILFWVSLNGCENKSTTEYFLNSKYPQVSNERLIKDTLILSDSLILQETYGMNLPGSIRIDEQYLYIADPIPDQKVFVIDKNSLDHKYTISPNEGRGPEEITGIGAIDISTSKVIIAAENLFKIQIWDQTGEFIKEFILDGIGPHRINSWDDGYITILSPSSPKNDNVFHTMDGDGNLVMEFGAVSNDSFNPLKYSGATTIDGDYFFYAGFSEHILQKWTREGELKFSRSTIEDYPSELNYVTFESGEQRSVRYSETGFYSAIGLFIYDDHIIIMHGGDRNDPAYRQLLDFYSKTNGDYQFSLEVPYNASSGSFAVDDEYIYVMHKNDNGDDFLGLYLNSITSVIN